MLYQTLGSRLGNIRKVVVEEPTEKIIYISPIVTNCPTTFTFPTFLLLFRRTHLAL